MRTLHKLTMKEAFIASGTYEFYREGVLLAGREHWTIHQLPDGAHFVRIDADWRETDGTSQLAEALYQPLTGDAPTGALDRFVRQHHYSAHVERESYDFYPDHVMIGYDDEDGVRQDAETQLPAGYVALLSMDVLTGLAVAHMAHIGGDCDLFSGYDTAEEEALVTRGRVVAQGIEVLEIDGQTHPARVYDLVYDDQPDESQRIWLAEAHPILLKRRAPDGTHTLLTRYAHRR